MVSRWSSLPRELLRSRPNRDFVPARIHLTSASCRSDLNGRVKRPLSAMLFTTSIRLMVSNLQQPRGLPYRPVTAPWHVTFEGSQSTDLAPKADLCMLYLFRASCSLAKEPSMHMHTPHVPSVHVRCLAATAWRNLG